MLFNSTTFEDIFTPIGTLGEKNPFFTSHDPSPSAGFICNIDGEKDWDKQDDLFSNIDLSDLDLAEFSMEKDADASSDLQTSTFAEESMFLPVPDESDDSAALPWVAEECTVESVTTDDGSSPAVPSAAPSRARPTRQHHLSLAERKLRKKGQNKTAAEKYRLKKRTERDSLAKREAQLKKRNETLKSDLKSMKYRLEQFKQLFVDVLQIRLPEN